MELVQYIYFARKWSWLILIAAFVGGVVTFIVRSGQPSTYQAQAVLAIGAFIEAPNPNSAEINTGIQLAQTYAELVKTRPVMQATIDELDLSLTYEELRGLVTVRILNGTSLLVIVVQYTDPVLTADIANTLTQQLILNSPTNLTPEQEAQIVLANAQIDELNVQLSQLRTQLAAVNERLATSNVPTEVTQLTVERNTIIDQINLASSTIAQFSGNITDLQRRTNSLDIVEPAEIPVNPSGTSVLSNTLILAVAAAAVTFGAVLVIEYLDDTIKSSLEAAQTLASPILGVIMRFGKKDDTYPERLVTNLPPQSPAAEGYRKVRTNLFFTSSNAKQKRVYVVTSPGASEGKSVTTSNLAVTMALAGLNVLLIDADLRRPRLHEVFGLNNDSGLTSLLFVNPSSNGSTPKRPAANLPEGVSVNLLEILHSTDIPRLRVITSGFTPSNPSEILGSALMQHWIDEFLAASNIDVILIDTPPCLMVADSSILASTANADVILVVEAGRTRRAAAAKAREEFERVGRPIVGVVVNGVNPIDEYYHYYGYGYDYAGYYQDQAPKPPKWRFWLK